MQIITPPAVPYSDPLVGPWASTLNRRLPKWKFGINQRMVIACMADSIGEAVGAGSPGVVEDHGYVGLLRQGFQRQYGFGGHGLTMPWKTTQANNPIFAGTWVAYAGATIFNGGKRTNAGDTAATVTLTVVGDSIDVFYVDNNVNPSGITCAVDGGAGITVAQTTLNNLKTNIVTFDLGTVGTHTVVLSLSAGSTGYFILAGISSYIGSSGAVIHDLSQAGFTAWGSTGGASNGTGAGNNALDLNILDTLRPDLTTIQFGTNEFINNQPLAVYDSALTFIINRAKTAGRTVAGDINGDVLLIVPPMSSYVAVNTLGLGFADYAKQAKATATKAGIPWVSINDLWGTWTQANAAGYMNDASHPNNSGYLSMAAALWEALRLS